MTTTPETFDPRPYLKPLNGKQYLEVAHRLQWLRAEHADAIITTELLHLDWEAGYAVHHAHVEIPGGGIAEGTGSETRVNFSAGWVEKSETVAVGRACAMLGYGTAFALELEEGHPADAPVERPAPTPTNGNGTATVAPTAYMRITDAQRKLIFLTAHRDRGMRDEEVEALIEERYGKPLLHLSKAEASAVIDALKQEAHRGNS